MAIFRVIVANSNLGLLGLKSETSKPEPAFPIKVMKFDLLIMTEEFAVDLDSCLCWGRSTVPYL